MQCLPEMQKHEEDSFPWRRQQQQLPFEPFGETPLSRQPPGWPSIFYKWQTTLGMLGGFHQSQVGMVESWLSYLCPYLVRPGEGIISSPPLKLMILGVSGGREVDFMREEKLICKIFNSYLNLNGLVIVRI
ncbi:hypothetical protein JTE90_011950 [Oedothorax gibbosus]|uniref:Uncharacterized protein n=1 Tax=Oedothorax gibbosus TaxID=931172 RepID=A0AAV6V114_9ARAC|nr:hypothetical protein JTE90_011950 [Oedothorax gibbosus]